MEPNPQGQRPYVEALLCPGEAQLHWSRKVCLDEAHVNWNMIHKTYRYEPLRRG